MKLEKISLIDQYYKKHNNTKIAVQSSSISNSDTELGKNLSRQGRFDEAINIYKQTLTNNSENYDAQFELAKTFRLKEDYKSAAKEFEKCVNLNQNDNEARMFLGDCYKQQGLYSKAIDIFSEITKQQPENDFAQRNLKESQNRLEFVYNPQKAYNKLIETKISTLKEAYLTAKQNLPKNYTDSFKNVEIVFDETEKIAGYSNIAQYEHFNKKITISNDYIWANPKLVASYLIHEFVHAKDNDAYTSIREEQDAFTTQVKYWQKHGNGLFDPEMDYILELYEKSPKALNDRIRQIYKSRDTNIAETSPNHPVTHSAVKLQDKPNMIPITYNAIA